VSRPRLLFVSTRFLFPVDSGGKIRTTQILRGLKGGRFDVTLASPAPANWRERHAADIAAVADEFIDWPERPKDLKWKLWRVSLLTSSLPVPVASDRSAAGAALIEQALREQRPDVVVADFAHAAVLVPERIDAPSVMFTHNVEAEIFERHARVAANPVMKAVWRGQLAKMTRFEGDVLRRYGHVVAVADRDAKYFAERYGVRGATVIPTGVDLDYFDFREPPAGFGVVFTGSMDWLANQDGISFLMDEVWPHVAERLPAATMTVVGRAPPGNLVRRASALGLNWRFTGFVDDVRPFMREASAYVIPLRVGGGTRLKAFEAMACGCPIVSTQIGVEGLSLAPGRHYRCADTAAAIAAELCDLLGDHARAVRLAREARELVEKNYSFRAAARVFESACESVLRKPGP
jgi:glycosyltransferase involved in cell wall biosynthesis